MERPGDKGLTGGRLKLGRSRDRNVPAVFTPRRLEELSSPRLKEAFAVWQGKRGASDGLPAAADFDILDYRSVVGNINFLEVRSDPLDFIYRVHSATGAKYVGQDLTGRSIDDYRDPHYRDFIRASCLHAVQSKAPHFVVEELFTADDRRMRWEAALLPLQDEAGAVSRLVVPFEILN